MTTLDRERATAAEQEVEALTEEARERQRRRHRAIALILIAAAGTTLGVPAITAGRSARGSKRSVGSTPISAPVLRAAGTTPRMWPAGAPNFGDLPGGGSGTTVQVDNLATGHASLRRIPGIAGGDFS
jgi:hypothetical protein